MWLINTHNGIKGKLERINIEDYPAVKDHLDQYWDKISTRADKGDTPYNLRNCAYLDDFIGPKAMWKIIGSNICFSYDEEGMFCNNAVNIITGDTSRLVQFVGMMNSKLFEWYLKITNEAPIADERVQLYVTTLEKTLLKLDFPHPLPTIIAKRLKGEASDKDIDYALYQAYQLSSEEIGYLESM